MAIGHPPEAPVRATITLVVADHSDYPTDLERDVTLKDGTALRLRPIRPDDAPRLISLYNRLSRLTAYQRFFSVMKRLPPDWARLLATVDYHRRLALVAERGPADAPEIEAVARYEPTDDPGTVEVAFAIQDGYQGKGLGTLLLRHLLDAAEARGIHRFRAYVLADNQRMLALFSRLTDIRERRLEYGVVTLLFERRAIEPPAHDG
jgi:RimJ/RimL family protein N-acetyltransferase